MGRGPVGGFVRAQSLSLSVSKFTCGVMGGKGKGDFVVVLLGGMYQSATGGRWAGLTGCSYNAVLHR